MNRVSDYFYDEDKFFDRYIMNAPILNASCFNVTQDTLISSIAVRKIANDEPPQEFIDYANSCCPEILEQGEVTRSFLLKSAFLVKDKEKQLSFLKHFSHHGLVELYEKKHYEFSLIYDMVTPEITGFVITQLVLMREADSDDLVASFITKDISRLRQFRKIAITAINSVCDSISIIDTRARTISFESVSNELRQFLPNDDDNPRFDYDSTFLTLLKSFAKSAGNTPLDKLITIENIIRTLNEKGEFVAIIDFENKYGEISRKQVMYQWFDNTKRYIVSLQSDVSTTYHEEMLQLEKLNHDLSIKLGRDQVTGLPNKNSSTMQIDERFIPGDSAVILFDLTNLIYLNNTVGRDVGNMLLYQFAHIVSTSLPAGCFVGRYTGAEIIAMMNCIKHGDEEEYLQTIREKIENYNNENPDCPIEYVSVTIFSSDYENYDFSMLYDEAFQKLSEAKNKQGTPLVAKEDLTYQLQAASNRSRELEYSSRHDGLTGLLNKTAGMDDMADLARFQPRRYHVMFVMDIDNFKHINDTFGHDFGDDILKKTAEILKAQFRPKDILTRYGGDEFIAFMADVSGPAQIEDKARGLIEAVDAMLFECGCRKTPDTDTYQSDSTGISIGIVWTDKAAAASKMFVQADAAMYDAKHMGKNRFEITRNMGFSD